MKYHAIAAGNTIATVIRVNPQRASPGPATVAVIVKRRNVPAADLPVHHAMVAGADDA